MLTRLQIENLGLIELAELHLDRGLTVLTGETGAGKSMVVTALSLILGGRGDREFVRHGAERCVVTAEFEFTKTDLPVELQALVDDGKPLIVRRTITDKGQSTATVNGRRVSIAALRDMAESLAEIVGQHANQRLMNEENHLGFLDEFAGLNDSVMALQDVFSRWQKAAAELKKVLTRREQLEQHRELLLFQKGEIEQAGIQVGEEEKLLAERRILDSARALMTSASAIGDILDGEDHSALDLLRLARQELDRMATIDAGLEKRSEAMYDVQLRLEELRGDLERYGASIVDDPDRLDQINARLDEVYHLKKKYGGSEEEIIKTLAAINGQLRDRPNTQSLIDGLEAEIEASRSEYSRMAITVSEKRRKAARRLADEVVNELRDLAIDAARFEFAFGYEEDPAGVILDGRAVRAGEQGLEQVRIMFSANPGEPLRSLVKTASGGEISRVLLALKAAAIDGTAASTPLIFDEVDAGIGGQTATQVAAKLGDLAQQAQLIIVTHLHQIARAADHHLAITKVPGRDGRRMITITDLNPAGVEVELERMVGLPETAK